MKKRSVIIVVSVLVVAAAGIYAWTEYHREPETLAGKEADFTLSTSELIGAFKADTAAAGRKYIDRVLKVSGYVKSYDTSGVITMGIPDEISSIQCSMDDRQETDFSSLHEGKEITVKGVCNGYQRDELLGTDVKMNYCVLVND